MVLPLSYYYDILLFHVDLLVTQLVCVENSDKSMLDTIELPINLMRFELPKAVQARLQHLLDRQDAGELLTQDEQQEAEGLVELAEFLSLLHLQAMRTSQQVN
jgi:ribosome assembly protein YihI (activator of Der GTPase)